MLFLLFKNGKIKISNVSLLYCHCHFALSAKEVFLCRNSQLGPGKSVHFPPRTVRYTEVNL